MQVSQSHHDDKENYEPALTEKYANTVTNTSLQQQMLKTLQSMKKEIQELKSQQSDISSDSSKRKQRQPKKESTFPSIVGRMERGVILARIARRRPPDIKMNQNL